MTPGRELARSSEEIRVRDELLKRLGHDVRTPIGAILTWLELLKGYSSDSSQARHAVEMARQSAHELTEIVAAVEDAQRMLAGTIELEMASVDLAGLVRASAEGVRPSAESRGIVLDADLGPSPALVRGDDRRLGHVFKRVLLHCVSLSGPGIVRLALQADPHEATATVIFECPSLTLSASLQQALVADGEWPSLAGPSGQAVLDFAAASRVIHLHGGRLGADSSNGPGVRLSASLLLA